MPSYSTPGVYVEEISVFPPSVAPVATAIPAFIGYTMQAIGAKGEDLTKVPTRITSMLEYQQLFGTVADQDLSVDVTKVVNSDGALLNVDVSWNGTKPTVPNDKLYYSMQLYFDNGGGPCYIYSVGEAKGNTTAKLADFKNAISALESVDEPTLLVFPDATNLSDANHGSVVKAGLDSANKTQDRFVVCDVVNAVPGGTDSNADVSTNFRGKVAATTDFLKYGAAYFPYANTNIPFAYTDGSITIKTYTDSVMAADGSVTDTPDPAKANKKLATLGLESTDASVYAAIQAFVAQAYITLPPSGAIAGVYARVDRTRGVHKAPANVGLARVLEPAIEITNDLQDGLNIDPDTGKSVNCIRAFFGKGTLVWGARTLAGNDNEWRYVNVRRLANMIEESVEKASNQFVFEPNTANTWVKVQTMIENFLINQWRDGALMGSKPEQAFRVEVGLGKTMTADDVLNGKMIIDVHLAMVRPAEFIVLRFMQKMPEA